MKNFLILFLISNTIWAQVQFEAKVSKSTLGINENLRIDFIMNADGDNFTPPPFTTDGFKVVGGPSQQVSQSWVNGRSSFNKTYSYYLLPQQKGTLTIRQATIEINGQIYKTNPIKVTVTNAVEKPKDPNDTQLSADTELHLVADVSKSNPYLNEPITVVYKLYFSNNIGITNWRELNKPKYNNFWSQNIDIKQLVLEQGKYNGENYRFVVLRKTVLYPQKSGKLEIEPLSLDVDVQLPSNRRNIFGQVMVVADNKRVSAGAKTIMVRSLPETGKPKDFSGAVGRFEFKAIPSKTTLKSGESLDLNVSVSGSGNLKLFSLPKPIVPSSLEMYDPEHKENVTTPLTGMQGSISDKYTIIPQFKGQYVVKPMEFTFFDLGTGNYKTIATKEIMITVLDGPKPTNTAVASSTNENPKARLLASQQFKYIKLKTKLIAIKSKDFFGSKLYYFLQFLPFLIIPIIVLLKRKQEIIDGDITGNRIKLNSKLAKKYLSEAKKYINQKEPFYIALEKAMHNFLKAKLHIETSDMSKNNIQDLLLSKNANPDTVLEFLTLTENCELARYAPSTNAAIQNDYEKAVSIISELEKQLN